MLFRTCAIVIDHDAHTLSEPKTSFNDWMTQKYRHYTTSKYYKKQHSFLFLLFNYKNKWYYTTTKCIDNLDLTNNISYGIMLLETLNNNKDNLKKLEEIMNKDYNYN